MTSKSRN